MSVEGGSLDSANEMGLPMNDALRQSFMGTKIYLAHEMIRQQAQQKAKNVFSNVEINVTQKFIVKDVEVADGETSGSVAVDLDSGERLVIIGIGLVDDGNPPDNWAIKLDGADEYLMNNGYYEPIISPEWINGDFRIYNMYDTALDGTDAENTVTLVTLSVVGL